MGSGARIKQFRELYVGVSPQNEALAGLQADSIPKYFTSPSLASALRGWVGSMATNIARYHFTGFEAEIRQFSKLFVGVRP